MFIVRAPLRISLAGGGTDIPSFYRESMGEVISFAINKYVYLAFHETFRSGIRLAYSQTENISSTNQIKHPLFRNAFQHMGSKDNLEIGSFADIPAEGTGLGSSSAFTVALVKGLSLINGIDASQHEIAEKACHIEINLCNDPIGKQDQFASAYGGFNHFRFFPNETVTATPVKMQKSIQDCLLLFYLDMSRSASAILKLQATVMKNGTQQFGNLSRIRQQVETMKNSILIEDFEAVGASLHENWILKREMTELTSNPEIDELYELALRNGALGGKVLGAGGGGFLLLCVKSERRQEFIDTYPLRHVPFEIDVKGVFQIPLGKEVGE
jgi:D-glycero-alpha-D-manno-heptose-7-phosphate kinase